MALCLLSLIFAANSASLAAERNIVFFITDDESPTLGCYGDPVAVTPAVDQLAKSGTLFLNAYATTASCSASRSVVMTGVHNHLNGQYGHEHDFHHFSTFANAISLALPPAMRNAGYRTAQIGKLHVGPHEVYEFETYLKGPARNPVEMAEACRKFISKSDERPFFLYFATADPHRSGQVDESSKSELKPNLFGNKPGGKAYPGVKEVIYDPAKVPVPLFLPDTPECREELAQYYQACSRVDQGLARLIEILKEAGVYEKTLIVFTSDHGMAMPGAKTTVYEAGLKVPFVVYNPYIEERGVQSAALISHVDITPSLLDFAGALNHEMNRPKKWTNPDQYWRQRGERLRENRAGGHQFNTYHGKSWIPLLGHADSAHHEAIFASHTFHEIQMYYPMRAVRDQNYKLIWNIADGLSYPFASDLWAASTWQTQYRLGPHAAYGKRTVGKYMHRPRFELYDMKNDPEESVNLASDLHFAPVLEEYKKKLRDQQEKLKDPWITKWDYE